MPNPDFYIKQGDTTSVFARTLEDDAGTPVNITGAAVGYAMRPLGGTAVVGGSASVVAATAGGVQYDWVAGDTDVAGMYLAEWEVTYANGDVQTFPNGGYDIVLITEAL